MCTLLTIDRTFYLKNTKAVETRIYNDALSNPDGFALLALDPDDETQNINLSSMNQYLISELIDRFFAECSEFGRIWLHSRMATTSYVGIAFNHGFTDQAGTVIMHNGVLNKNVHHLTVDSFKLNKLDWNKPSDALKRLRSDRETYANVFAIDTVDFKYTVLRLSVGSLHTDLDGNYSTREVGDICLEVENNSIETHYMPLPENKTSGYFDDYYSSFYDYADNDSDYMRAIKKDEVWTAKKA